MDRFNDVVLALRDEPAVHVLPLAGEIRETGLFKDEVHLTLDGVWPTSLCRSLTQPTVGHRLPPDEPPMARPGSPNTTNRTALSESWRDGRNSEGGQIPLDGRERVPFGHSRAEDRKPRVPTHGRRGGSPLQTTSSRACATTRS